MTFNKRNTKVFASIGTLVWIFAITMISYNSETKKIKIDEVNTLESSNVVESDKENIENSNIVYDGLTMEELTAKLDKTLSSNLEGYGNLFAQKSIELGLDPYLAVAITMHETGCKWGCSYLLRTCNNVAGIKGSPGCNGGSYKKFDSLEIGINYFLEMLYNNYYSKGLTTPELINPKYAEDKNWASKVNKYIESINAN